MGGMKVQIEKSDLDYIIQTTVQTVIDALEKKHLLVNANPKTDSHTATCRSEPRSAYQRTEQLLYNYNGFRKIVEERLAEIEEIKLHGIPKTSKSITQYGGTSGSVQGIVLDEESVERIVQDKMATVQDIVQHIAMIDSCMETLKTDPYYCILEMRYFEGRTQEDIAVELKCTQANVSKNKNRLVRELSLRLFPNQVISEMLN